MPSYSTFSFPLSPAGHSDPFRTAFEPGLFGSLIPECLRLLVPSDSTIWIWDLRASDFLRPICVVGVVRGKNPVGKCRIGNAECGLVSACFRPGKGSWVGGATDNHCPGIP
jgi:hypothetical protein